MERCRDAPQVDESGAAARFDAVPPAVSLTSWVRGTRSTTVAPEVSAPEPGRRRIARVPVSATSVAMSERLAVGVLAGAAQDGERLIAGQRVPLHEDAHRHTDLPVALQGAPQVLGAVAGQHRGEEHRAVRGQHEPGGHRPLVEGPLPVGVDVQGCGGLDLAEDREPVRQRTGDPRDLVGPRPPGPPPAISARHVVAAVDRHLGRADTRTRGFELQRVRPRRGETGGGRGAGLTVPEHRHACCGGAAHLGRRGSHELVEGGESCSGWAAASVTPRMASARVASPFAGSRQGC